MLKIPVGNMKVIMINKSENKKMIVTIDEMIALINKITIDK